MEENLRVQIKNYQVIEKADLTFTPGLNIIVGRNSSGKTSLVRAIKGVVSNTISDAEVNDQANKTEVRITYNGNYVHYKRDLTQASKVAYLVNDKVYSKIGRVPLKEAQDALNIREVETLDTKRYLNLLEQWDKPFGLDASGSILYQLIVNSEDESRLVEAMKMAKVEIGLTQQEINFSMKRIDVLSQKVKATESNIKKLSGASTVIDNILETDKDIKQIEEIEREVKKRRVLNSQLIGIRERLNIIDSLTNKDIKEEQVKVVSGVGKELIKREELIKRRDGLIDKVKVIHIVDDKTLLSLEESIIKTREVNRVVDEIKVVVDKRKTYKVKHDSLLVSLDKFRDTSLNIEEETVATVSKIDALWTTKVKELSKLDRMYSEFKVVSSSLDSIEEELSSFKECPLCGQSLDKED